MYIYIYIVISSCIKLYLILSISYLYAYDILGLLSTEAGTIGRVVGDMTITILSTYLGSTTSPAASTSGSGIDMSMNKTNSIINLVNCLYAPIGIGIVVSIILIHYFSTRLDSIDIPR